MRAEWRNNVPRDQPAFPRGVQVSSPTVLASVGAHWQVFGLASLAGAPPASSLHHFPTGTSQCEAWRSFSLTAAGQPRIFTAFPLAALQSLQPSSTSAHTRYWGRERCVNQDVGDRPPEREGLQPLSRLLGRGAGVRAERACEDVGKRRDLRDVTTPSPQPSPKKRERELESHLTTY